MSTHVSDVWKCTNKSFCYLTFRKSSWRVSFILLIFTICWINHNKLLYQYFSFFYCVYSDLHIAIILARVYSEASRKPKILERSPLFASISLTERRVKARFTIERKERVRLSGPNIRSSWSLLPSSAFSSIIHGVRWTLGRRGLDNERASSSTKRTRFPFKCLAVRSLKSNF